MAPSAKSRWGPGPPTGRWHCDFPVCCAEVHPSSRSRDDPPDPPYRLYPGDAATGNALRGTAGAARFTWNLFVDLCKRHREMRKANPLGPKPSVAFFTLDKLFTQVRNGQLDAWLAAALQPVCSDIDYELLNTTASDLRKRARWSSPMKLEIRYVVAAMMLRRQLDPAFIHAYVIEIRDAFKDFRISRSGQRPHLRSPAPGLALRG